MGQIGSFHDHGVKTSLGVETTLWRCRNYPLFKGTEMTPRGQNTRSKLLFWIYSVGQFQLQFIWHELHVYEITLVVICEMYNFIICEIYDLIFIYENSHMKLPKFTYMKWISYMKFLFSYVNCIISYMTWFSYMKILHEITKFHPWNGFHIWNLVFHMWII